MKPSPNLVLTGFMGCGKTTVGKLLAEELCRSFVDTDLAIEQEAGLSVSEIFAARGESAFRAMERLMAGTLALQNNLVIATGGKLMLDAENTRLLGKNGVVICLTAEPEEIMRRVQWDGDCRPLLTSDKCDNLQQWIKDLLQERREGYSAFSQVATDGKSPTEVVREVLALFKEKRAR